MPFIRDSSYVGYTAASNTVVGYMPAYAANDLLVAFITSDGGMTSATAPNTTAAGWTYLGHWAVSTASNTSSGMLVMVKYATAPEADTTFTLTSGTADTVNVTMISIGDVFYDAGTGVNAVGPRTANVSGTAPWAAARKVFTNVTTTEDESLLLYLCVAGGVGSSGVASILEGPVTQINSQDGSAHSDGCAWGYKQTAGAGPTDVFAKVVGTTAPAGFQSVLSIRPPAGGITVRPAYVVTDNCKLLNVLTGSAETNSYGNTSATSANTYFTPGSLTLNSKAVAVGGTTYTLTDTGINSFHSSAALLGITTANTWGSNMTVHPAMTDLAGFNLLLHVSPSIPKGIQNTTSVALAGLSGVALGLASTTGNAKAWHVHGAGTSYGQSPWVPVVINTENTTGVIGSVGTFNPASVTALGMFSGIIAVAATWLASSFWKLGTTVIAGGHSASPITPPDIMYVAATGKERRSVITQGAGQVVTFQPLQFGDGGSNTLFLNLRGAAFEFPRLYNKELKQVNYCSVDNKCGFIFYPGASDTIDLRNAVFSSPSKFLWQWHASSNAGATVSTSGMQVIGGGTVDLQAAVPMTSVSFTDCLTITQNACAMASCSFTNCTITSATLAAMASVTGSAFVSGGTGHALVVTGTAANIALTGNTFTGYAATNGSTGNEAIFVNIATGVMDINISGGGSTPSIRTAGATVTVQNSKTLTIKGLVTGSDITILTAGTETVRVNVEDNVGTTYAYAYTDPGAVVDIAVYLPGYMPAYQRSITLASSDADLPITQTPDASYLV